MKEMGTKSFSCQFFSQIKGEWDTKHPNLIPYKEHVLTLIPHFAEITFEHFPREENQLADALATMSSMFKVRWDNEAPQITIDRMDELAYCHEIDIEEVVDKPWFHDVIGGFRTDYLTLVREMSRKQESPPSFIFSKWKGQKHRKIP